MKKLTFAILAFAACLLTACDKDNPDCSCSYAFYDVCMNWGADKNTVYNYVAEMSGWTEDKELASSDNEIAFTNSETCATMTYTFSDEGLEAASVTYFDVNSKFDSLKNDVASKCGVTSWKEQPTQNGVTWFSGSSKEKSCNISVGYGDHYGEYMYVDYEYSAFIF